MQSLMRWNRKVFCFLALLLAVPCPSLAQKAVVEESVTEINCDSRTHAVVHYRQVTTILNAQGAYEWTIDSHDNLIEFPRFCPQTDYDVSETWRHSSRPLTAHSPKR